ncbi:GNAT family N-acetyltransferase [Halomicrobium salinisoli]|uniref:GNAT family N-acetyltransferase n=1 Tax=Halomicrobium salinisoli TaxID=2878391 RepID=UPI001CEFF926|nr:GNAT family N-acetyltransferase [Halomicrobium salinisoli]
MPVTVERSLGPEDVPQLVDLYETYDWWADRGETELRRALAATDEAVALRETESGDLVAAARVLTDYSYYAMVFDVIVHADRRGEGLGEELLAALVTHPPLADVDLELLSREGLVPFYEACGFEEVGAVDRPGGDPEELRFLAYRRDE